MEVVFYFYILKSFDLILFITSFSLFYTLWHKFKIIFTSAHHSELIKKIERDLKNFFLQIRKSPNAESHSEFDRAVRAHRGTDGSEEGVPARPDQHVQDGQGEPTHHSAAVCLAGS